MGKEYAEEGCQAGREEARTVYECSSDCDDPCRLIPYHRAAVRDVAPNDVPVTAARIMSTEFPRLKQIEDLKDYD